MIIPQTLKQFKAFVHDKGLSLDGTPGNSLVKNQAKRVIEQLKTIPDARVENRTTYPLYEVLFISIFASLSGANNWVELAQYAKANEKWFKRHLPLVHGTMPVHDTFQRVFQKLDVEAFEPVLVAISANAMIGIRRALESHAEFTAKQMKPLVAIDGTSHNASGQHGLDGIIPNAQTLNFYHITDGYTLSSKSIESKTNEIPVAQTNIPPLKLEGTIVTADALHTQTATVALLCASGAGYMLGLKGNQKTCFSEVKLYFNDVRLEQIRAYGGDNYLEVIEKAHSQTEIRRYYVSTDIEWFEDKGNWAGLRSFVACETLTEDLRTKKKTREVRFYITSETGANVCAYAIRGHWSIENQLHFPLDTTFRKDANTTVHRNSIAGLDVVNKFSLTMCKILQSFVMPNETLSLNSIRNYVGLEKDTTKYIDLALLGVSGEAFFNVIGQAVRNKTA